MLVLTRAVDQALVIDGNIIVRIVEVRGAKVRLGIEAPQEVSVHRDEIQAKVEAERVRNDSWTVTLAEGRVILTQGRIQREFDTIARAVEWLDWRDAQRRAGQ